MPENNDNVLQLSTLEGEYNSLLSDYKDKYAAYINVLKNASLRLAIKNSSKYVGVGLQTIKQETTTNETGCKDLCYATNLCDGANYDKIISKCSLFSNASSSSIASGTTNDFAIYNNIKKLHDELTELNSRLVQKNNQIFALIDQLETIYNQDMSKITTTTTKIEDNYLKLYDEKEKLDNLLQEFETYIEKDVSTKTQANQKYMIYVLLICVLIIIFILFIKILIV